MGETGRRGTVGVARALVGRRGKLGLFGTTLQWSRSSCAPLSKRVPGGRRRRLALGFLM